jgi:hypothetical protein
MKDTRPHALSQNDEEHSDRVLASSMGSPVFSRVCVSQISPAGDEKIARVPHLMSWPLGGKAWLRIVSVDAETNESAHSERIIHEQRNIRGKEKRNGGACCENVR